MDFIRTRIFSEQKSPNLVFDAQSKIAGRCVVALGNKCVLILVSKVWWRRFGIHPGVTRLRSQVSKLDEDGSEEKTVS